MAVLTVLALGRMILPVQAQQRGPIIDMHVHTNTTLVPDRNVQSLIAAMDESHVVKAFLSGSLEMSTAGLLLPRVDSFPR